MLNNYTLLKYLDTTLTPEKYKDYCPNGLQVEGQAQIKRIIGGVSLSEKLIDAAINDQAEAIIVHHGIFWQKDDYALTGVKKRRIEKLIRHNINLYAYHLPLDNHATLGNNVQLAQLLEIEVQGQTGMQDLIWYGKLKHPLTLSLLSQRVSGKLGHQIRCFSHTYEHEISRIAWCSGGGDGFFPEAIKLGVDVYLSGEASEPTMALAEESQVAYLAVGHYASERYGIQALLAHLTTQFEIPASYIELYNPV